MRCDEAQELITARVDDEIGAAESSALDGHFKTCADCLRAYEQESLLKRLIHSVSHANTAPEELRRSIVSKSAGQTAVQEKARRWGFFAGSEPVGWRPIMVTAALLLIVASLIYTQWPVQNVSLAALATHEGILSGKTALARTDDPARMRRELTQAVDGRFSPVVLDFSMMKLYPVSGFVHKVGAREMLVTVYQGVGPTITCFTFLGSEADAPQGAERYYDADIRLNFYSFAQGGTSAILHREGNVICVLVAKMSPADLLALLRGKSAHA